MTQYNDVDVLKCRVLDRYNDVDILMAQARTSDQLCEVLSKAVLLEQLEIFESIFLVYKNSKNLPPESRFIYDKFKQGLVKTRLQNKDCFVHLNRTYNFHTGKFNQIRSLNEVRILVLDEHNWRSINSKEHSEIFKQTPTESK